MPQTTASVVNVRVDQNVKNEIEKLFDSLGMNISTAVNIFFKQCLMEQGLPFQPKIKYNENMRARKEFLTAIDEAHKHAIAGGLSEDMSLDDINALISEARNV